tara:strand:+ start:616 stop:1278 length:663 start_codon:yes stop_codon:yes gene_type:complete
MYDINNSWYEILNKHNYSHVLKEINLLKETDTNIQIFPKEEDIFKCFQYFNIKDTKVVILGQDPYHKKNQANGLCFGSNYKQPPSLKNISAELSGDLNINLQDFTLTSWAEQGVLLLNSALTVEEKKPGSHIKLWNKFTSSIIDELNNLNEPIIFVAWGAYAHEKLKNINTEKHYLIISSHPSPLSVFRQYKTYPAFYNSNPFSKINDILKQNDKTIINW